jgi:hypothetical protein
MTEIDPADALRAAINVLRDSHECGRMPNGNALPPDAKDVHARAADCLQTMLTGVIDPELIRWRTAFFARCDAHNAKMDALLAELRAERKGNLGRRLAP